MASSMTGRQQLDSFGCRVGYYVRERTITVAADAIQRPILFETLLNHFSNSTIFSILILKWLEAEDFVVDGFCKSVGKVQKVTHHLWCGMRGGADVRIQLTLWLSSATGSLSPIHLSFHTLHPLVTRSP